MQDFWMVAPFVILVLIFVAPLTLLVLYIFLYLFVKLAFHRDLPLSFLGQPPVTPEKPLHTRRGWALMLLFMLFFCADLVWIVYSLSDSLSFALIASAIAIIVLAIAFAQTWPPPTFASYAEAQQWRLRRAERGNRRYASRVRFHLGIVNLTGLIVVFILLFTLLRKAFS